MSTVTPVWVIENFSKEQSYTELKDAVTKAGHNIKELIGGYKVSDVKEFATGKHCVIFCGSIEMTQLVRKELENCYPVAYCTPENYLCSKYYTHFGSLLFNDKYAMLTLNELHRQKFYYYRMFGKEALFFIRPDSGQKPFQAQLLDLQDIDRFCQNHKDVGHNLVLVSTPKTITGEYRFVCSKEKQVIAHSTYRFQSERTLIPAVPPGSLKKCKEVLEVGYYPDNVFVVDIGEDNDGNFWLMELDSFSSAGLYACDKDLIVKEVEKIAVRDFESAHWSVRLT